MTNEIYENLRLENNLKIDFKDILLQEIKFKIEEAENYPNLKKWLRYQLFQPQDADIVLKRSSIITRLKWYEDDVAINKRYLDCIFSMKTYLNMFLRFFNEQGTKYAWLLIYFDDVINDERIEQFAREVGLLEESTTFFKGCFSEIEKFARHTHTLGNYMYVPDSKYNSLKGRSKWLYNDRIDIFIRDIYSNNNLDSYNNYLKWFNENMDSLDLISLFEDLVEKKQVKQLFEFNLQKKMKFTEGDLESFYEYLKFVNQWIDKRTNYLINSIH